MRTPIEARKVAGVWYAWPLNFPEGGCASPRKRDAVEAAHRRMRRGIEGARADDRITDDLIDRPRPHRHPMLLRVEARMKRIEAAR